MYIYSKRGAKIGFAPLLYYSDVYIHRFEFGGHS